MRLKLKHRRCRSKPNLVLRARRARDAKCLAREERRRGERP